MSAIQTLTDEENTTMRILWDRGGASVNELAVATRRAPGETLTMLRRLRRKGAVDRHQNGARDVIYRPRLNRETARTHALGRLLSGDSVEDNGLGVVVLRESDVDPQDWADLQAEIAAKRARRQGAGR